MKIGSFQHDAAEMTFWPDPLQELLLRAALLSGAAAEAAFRKWLTLADRDRLDQGSYRLLPLLAHNLSRQGIRDPFLKLCQGVHRHTWVRNQLQLNQTRKLLQVFCSEGIDVMLLKGAALALAYYPDCGLRPFEDVDLLVPTAQAQPAFALLRRLGWRPCRFPVRTISPEYAGITHAVAMVNEKGLVVDLHWHLISECLSPDADLRFWRNSVPLDKGSSSLCLLGPTDQLFHACLHGYKHQVGWELIPPIRWVADALQILAGKAGQIDYRRLGCLAHELHLALALKLTLGYLHDRWAIVLPESFKHEMSAWPVSAWERAEWRTQQKPFGVLGGLPMMWRHYRRLKHSGATGRAVRNFASYLQHRFYLPHGVEMLPFLMSKGIHRLGRRVLRRTSA